MNKATKLHSAILAYVHHYVGMSNCNAACRLPAAMITYEHHKYTRGRLWFLCFISLPPYSEFRILADVPYTPQTPRVPHNIHGYNYSTKNMLPLCHVYGFDSTTLNYKWDYEHDVFKCP